MSSYPGGGGELRVELFTYWQERILSCLLMSTESENLSGLRSKRQKGSLWTGFLFGESVIWKNHEDFFQPFPKQRAYSQANKRDKGLGGKGGGEGNLIPWD